MPDYDFISKPQTPDSFKTIGSMLNFANQAQQLRTSQQEYQRGGVALEKEKALLQPQIEQGKAQSQTAQESAQQEHIKTIRAHLANGASQLANLYGTGATPDAVKKVLTDTGTNAGAHPDAIAQSVAGIPSDPAMIDKFIVEKMKSAMDMSSQLDKTFPASTMVQTGGATQPVAGGNPALTGVKPGTVQGASVPNAVTPGALETVEAGPDGNKYIVQRSPQGTILNTRPLAGAGQGAPQPSGPPAAMPFISPEDQATRPILEGERNVARNILGSAPIAHTTNRGILDEIENVAATGTAGPTIQKLQSVMGLAFGTKEEKASSYDLIGKYMERNALEAAKAMGPGTNAGLEAAIKANGSVAYNPTAIKRITKLNDAIVSGSEAYQPGLEKAIAANPQRGVLVKREFDQAWAQNFDPRIMQIANAAKSGDKAEIETIKKTLGKGGMAELVQKARNIEALSTQGRM